jgi:phosphodiester glycosidase/type IX secretion system substrate protein
MKFFNITLIFVLFAQILIADSIKSTPVGPGIIYHHETISSGPWEIQVMEIDRSNPWVQLETVKANDVLNAYERTSSMASRKDSEGHRVVGAINGDFYSTGGIPVGTQVLKGEMLKHPHTNRSVFGTDNNGMPFMDIVSFSGSLIKNDSVIIINDVNDARNTDELILYNDYFRNSTQTNEWGCEIIAQYISTDLMINDTFRLVVTNKDSINASGHGNNNIPNNGVILSGHGISRDFLNANIFLGDTISVVLNLPPVNLMIKELIGGTPRMIRDSVATVEWQQEGLSSSFANDRHPRTAVGFSSDSTKIYLITVDGRQAGYSVGMSLYELADYMLGWGIYQGINLDGGGSTTMVARGDVVNSPSDPGGERTVANALMVVSTAPTGPIGIIRIEPEEPYIIVGDQLQFSIKAFDQYYNPITTFNDSLLNWSCNPAIGVINSSGLFTADTLMNSGYIYVEYTGIWDSVLVNVTEIASINLQPNPVILEINEQQLITPEARDNLNNIVNLDPQDYSWSLTDSVGTISNTGLFTATQIGSGYIVANYHSVSGSSTVAVGYSNEVIIDDFIDLSNWSLSGTRVNLPACSLTLDNTINISPPSSGALAYELNTGGTSALYMNCSIPISGTPDAIGINVYGDGHEHWLRAEFEDNDGEKFLLNFTEAAPGINWTNTWQYLEKTFDEAIVHWSNPAAVLTYPITWTKIYLVETDDNKKDSGVIYFDDFKVQFISTSIGEESESKLLSKFQLFQNYPNPFNPNTTIRYSIPYKSKVKVEIYDITGSVLETPVNKYHNKGLYQTSWNAGNYASGMYFYRLIANDQIETRKMIVLQ